MVKNSFSFSVLTSSTTVALPLGVNPLGVVSGLFSLSMLADAEPVVCTIAIACAGRNTIKKQKSKIIMLFFFIFYDLPFHFFNDCFHIHILNCF